MMVCFRMILEAEAVPEQQVTFAPLIVFAVLMVAMYAILVLPQRKKEKELKKQVEELSVGDKVITIGGLVGFVANIKDNEVTISTSVANTLVTFQKAAISTIIKREDLNKTAEDK
ncbi:MAG: preprotein translocase subunit YajC [Clostridia bacterium]|nr:preprotein translocase subunit YajC [Clostridia bacterium]